MVVHSIVEYHPLVQISCQCPIIDNRLRVCFETSQGFCLCHKLESWFPNSRKNGLSNSENQRSVGCVFAELQRLKCVQ